MKTSRTPLPYNRKILELFKNPKNLGKMENASISAVAGNPVCGDMIVFYLRINNSGVITRASFESFGCAANIATSSMATEMVKGMKLEEAWQISWKKIIDAVGGVPSVKLHCGILAAGALKRAIRKYCEKQSYSPQWLPARFTFEEKQALEEDELSQTPQKKMENQRKNV